MCALVGCILHVIIIEFVAGPLQKSHPFSKCAKAKVVGFGDDFKDVLAYYLDFEG